MKRFIYISFLLTFIICDVFAQTEALTNYKLAITEMFAGIPANKVTTGVLIEKSIAEENIEGYNGSQKSDTCSFSIWKNLYKQYCFAQYDYSKISFNLDFIDSAYTQTKDEIPMGLLLFEYNQIKPDAIKNKQVIFDIDKGKVYDVSSNSTNILDEKVCIAASPMISELEPGTYFFTFSKDFCLGNISNFQYLQVDFDDGQGFIQTKIGESLMVTYSNPGEKCIRVKLKINGMQKYCYSNITILPLESENALKSFSFDIEPDDGPISYWSNDIEAEYAIYNRCNSDGTIRKPYIIVSGFDPQDKNRLVDANNKVNLYRISNKNGYLDQLRSDGYDIIIYRSKNSTESIIPNALNLVSFIQKINHEKTSNNELIIAGASMGGLVVRYALTYMEYHKIDHQTRLFISVDSPQEGANVPLGIQYMVKYLNRDLIDKIEKLKEAESKMLNSVAAKEMLLYHHSATSGKTAKCSDLRTSFIEEMQKIGNFPQQCRTIGLSMGSGNGTGQGFSPGDRMLQKNPKMSALVADFTPTPRVTWEFSIYAVPYEENHLVYTESVNLKACMRILGTTTCSSGATIASRKEYVNNTNGIDNAPGSIQNFHNTKAFRGSGYILGKDYLDVIDALGDFDYEGNPDNFIPTYSSLGLQGIKNPSLNVKTYLSMLNGVVKLSDNLYVNKDPRISLFDVMYVENKNLDHIYDDNKIGVFTSEMSSVMLQESSAENMYVENETIHESHKKAAEAKKNVYIGNDVDEFQYNNGDVVLESGSTMSVLANESIMLKPGLKIEKGALFSAKIGNDTYCDYSDENTIKSFSICQEPNEIQNDTPESEMVTLIKEFAEPVVLYPNPICDKLYVSSNKTNNKVYVYDVKGKRLIVEKFEKNIEINCERIPAGSYLVKIIQGNGNVVTKSIVKQ